MPRVRFTPGHGLRGYNGNDIGTGEPLHCEGPSVLDVSEVGAEYLCSTFANFTREGEAPKVKPPPVPEEKEPKGPPPRVSRFKRRKRDE